MIPILLLALVKGNICRILKLYKSPKGFFILISFNVLSSRISPIDYAIFTRAISSGLDA